MLRHGLTPRLTLLAMVICACAGFVRADPPQLVRYQARLTDAAGVSLTGSHDLTFSMHDAVSGGATLWSEGPVAVDLSATDGVLDVLLGGLTPLPASVFSAADRWLEVTADGVPLAPRQRLTSVPYALAAGDASTVGGLSVQQIQQAAAAAIQPFVTGEAIDTSPAFPPLPLEVDAATVGLWRMDGAVGSAAKQDNAQGVTARDLTETGAMSAVPGFDGTIDGAYEFPSSTTTSYVTFGNEADYRFGTSDFTLECWMKVVDQTVLKWAIVKRYSGGNNSGFYILVLPSGSPRFMWSGFNDDFPAACSVTGPANIADGEWHHIAGVRAGTSSLIYVDGELANTTPGCNNENTDTDATMDTFRSSQNFPGALDEVRVSNVARTAGEIASYFFQRTGPVPVYLDGMGKARVASSASSTTSAVIGFAVRDQVLGVDEVVQVSVVPGTTVDGFVGLTPGAVYYLQDAAGANGWIGTTPGTVEVEVGIARSASELIFR